MITSSPSDGTWANILIHPLDIQDNQQHNDIQHVRRSSVYLKFLRFSRISTPFSVVLDTTWIPQMYEQASSIPPLKEAMESEFQALKENGP